jgi:hypothetical protein
VNPLALRWLAGAAGLLAILGMVLWVVHDLEAAGAAKEHAARLEDQAATAAAVVAQQKEDATISARRVQNLSEIAHDATVQADRARAAAATADRSRDALRVQLDAFVREHARPADPAASAAGQADGVALGVLAKLFREADDFAGEVAADADASRVAGSACEAAYGQLTEH